MKIINRTGTVLTIRWYDATDGMGPFSVPAHTDVIHSGQGLDGDYGYPQMMLAIFDGEINRSVLDLAGPYGSPKYCVDFVAPFPNNSEVLLVAGSANRLPKGSNHLGKYGAVNWSTAKPGAPAPESPEQKNDAALQSAMAIVNMLLSAAATSLTTIGPAGFLPSGGAVLISQLLLFFTEFDKGDPPQPPSSDQIADAVRAVVTDVIQQNEALRAATRFQGAVNWLSTWAVRARSTLKTNLGMSQALADFGEHDRTDFKDQLEDWVKESSDLTTSLQHMRNNPEMAKYIIPAFLGGTIAMIDLQLIHQCLRAAEASAVTRTDITNIANLVNASLNALENSLSAYEKYRNTQLNKTFCFPDDQLAVLLDSVDEARILCEHYNAEFLGDSDLTHWTSAKQNLRRIHTGLTVQASLTRP